MRESIVSRQLIVTTSEVDYVSDDKIVTSSLRVCGSGTEEQLKKLYQKRYNVVVLHVREPVTTKRLYGMDPDEFLNSAIELDEKRKPIK